MENAINHQVLVTLVTAICLGIALIAISRKWGFPAIILLLASGFVLGPEGVGLVHVESLGPVFPAFVSLAVGIVLFEGGLTLDISGYRQTSKLIRRLLTVGVLVTWFGTAAAIWFVVGIPLSFAFLAASLVIVTGPTVIAPLLKLVRIKPRLHSVLSWEAVLIDPIGVFIAVLCFEWITRGSAEEAVIQFTLRVVTGLVAGVLGGELLNQLLRRRLIPEDMISVAVLAGAVFVFGVAEILIPESGLLAAIVGGLLLGARQPEELRRIRRFKAEITELMIGTLFILLASRLELQQFLDFGWRGAIVVALLIVAVRPLSVVICSLGLGYSWRERSFLAWVAPRGIVAASMASLFRLSLEGQQEGTRPEATALAEAVHAVPAPSAATPAVFIETFTYVVIVTTIVLYGLSMSPVARLLGLSAPAANGWLVVGAHRIGRKVARFLSDLDIPVLLVDTDPELVYAARGQGLEAVVGDARNSPRLNRVAGGAIGHVLALSDNEELNILICQWWAESVGSQNVFRWSSGRGEKRVERESRGVVVWDILPKPGELSEELEQGEIALVEERNATLRNESGLVPVLAIRDGKVVLTGFDSEKEKPVEYSAILYIERRHEPEAAAE